MIELLEDVLKDMLKDKFKHSKVGAKVAIFTLFILSTKGVNLGIDFKNQPSDEELNKALDNLVDYILRDLNNDQKELLFFLIENY